MSDKLDRDTLFKKLRAKPENKVRAIIPVGKTLFTSLPHFVFWQPYSRCLRLYSSERASEFTAPISAHIDAVVQCCSYAANRGQRSRLMSGVPSNLTTGVAAVGLLRLSCEKPNMVISPLRRLHMFSMCRCTQKLGGSPVICQVGSVAGLASCGYELYWVSSCLHLVMPFSD